MTTFFKDGAFAKMFPKASKELTADLDRNMNRWLADQGCPSKDNALMVAAQLAEESAGLTVFAERLSYSAARLVQVWPKRFPNIKAATPYARNPMKLANKVYANRMGNGDERSGDGWRYRGKGGFQITGHDNHEAVSKHLGVSDIMKDPELLLETPMIGPGIVAIYRILRLNEPKDMTAMTKRINGGYTNLKQRTAYHAKLKGLDITPLLLQEFEDGGEEPEAEIVAARDARLDDYMADLAQHLA